MFNLWAQGWGAHLRRNESMYSKERGRMNFEWIDAYFTHLIEKEEEE